MGIKKINLFNSTKKFREGFVRECESKGIELNLIRNRFVVVHLKNNEDAKFVYKNDVFDIKNALNFFQMRGNEALIPAMLMKYCDKNQIYFNDPVNTEHTRNVGKMMQMLMLHMENLPIPATLVVNSLSYEKNREYILENASFPLVLKAKGDRGKAVWKIDSVEELEERIVLSDEEKKEVIASKEFEVYLLQEYIPNTPRLSCHNV